jgi:hypothetical protein
LPNRPHAFNHRDVVRVVKAARAAGVDVKAVAVDPHSGMITVTASGTEPQTRDLDDWIEQKKEKNARPA